MQQPSANNLNQAFYVLTWRDLPVELQRVIIHKVATTRWQKCLVRRVCTDWSEWVELSHNDFVLDLASMWQSPNMDTQPQSRDPTTGVAVLTDVRGPYNERLLYELVREWCGKEGQHYLCYAYSIALMTPLEAYHHDDNGYYVSLRNVAIDSMLQANASISDVLSKPRGRHGGRTPLVLIDMDLVGHLNHFDDLFATAKAKGVLVVVYYRYWQNSAVLYDRADWVFFQEYHLVDTDLWHAAFPFLSLERFNSIILTTHYKNHFLAIQRTESSNERDRPQLAVNLYWYETKKGVFFRVVEGVRVQNQHWSSHELFCPFMRGDHKREICWCRGWK